MALSHIEDRADLQRRAASNVKEVPPVLGGSPAKALGEVEQNAAASAPELVIEEGKTTGHRVDDVVAESNELNGSLSAMELVALCYRIVNDLPVGYAFLADQLKRAACSVPLNFAEGYGKGTLKEQRRFFRIARGSACEVAAVLDVARTMGVMGDVDHAVGKDICDHLARMLTRFRRPSGG